ncbi:5'/3'-nucleotidase SurE [Nitrospirota bacterium]
MELIMLSNDDGVHAEGLKELRREIEKLAEVCVVAPDRERSAAGHSLTIHKPLKVSDMGSGVYSLNGTPTDCVAIGLDKVVPRRPAMIISGINHGPNLGDDITYSGTVAAAMEGTILSIPSIAVSLNMLNGEEAHFESAAVMASRVARFVLKRSLPYDTLLNINVPNLPLDEIKGMKFSRQGKRVYDGAIRDIASPWGETFYWIGGGTPYWEHGEDTDITIVKEGYVSITPLQLDLTNYWAMDFLTEQWNHWTQKNSET